MLSQPLAPDPPGGGRPTPLLVDVSLADTDTLVVTPIGEADLFTVPSLRHALREAAGEGWARVVVDLDRLTFMDASTLGVLVDARRRIREVGGTLQVRCHTPRHRRLLTMTWLDGLLEPTG